MAVVKCTEEVLQKPLPEMAVARTVADVLVFCAEVDALVDAREPADTDRMVIEERGLSVVVILRVAMPRFERVEVDSDGVAVRSASLLRAAKVVFPISAVVSADPANEHLNAHQNR